MRKKEIESRMWKMERDNRERGGRKYKKESKEMLEENGKRK